MLKNSFAFSGFSVDDLEQAKDFYSQTLKLDVSQNQQGLTLNLAGGGKVFIYPKPDHVPATYTVLNFPVDSIDETVDQLSQAGVKFEKYDNEYIKTDEKGIARDPHGPMIAWFKDPAGNFLSIIEDNKH